jgi:alginate O-acetyltransferase complex protein AlgJ
MTTSHLPSSDGDVPKARVRPTALRGQAGWLFLRQDTNDVLGQHGGRLRLSRRELAQWTELLRSRKRLTSGLGAEWLCLIAPDKEAVYADRLPPEIPLARRRTVHQVLRTARRARAPVTYPLDELRAARAVRDVYPKTDTHWDRYGAYVAYRLVCDGLARRGVEVPVVGEDRITWSTSTVPGSLGSKLEPAQWGPITRAALRGHVSRLAFDNRIHVHGRTLIFETRSGDGLSCVAFGESMANNLLLYLKESFGRLVFVHTSMLLEDVVRAERPDVVLNVPLERFLIRVPDDGNGLERLRRIVARKVRRGRVRDLDEPFLRGIPRWPGAGEAEVGQLPWRVSRRGPATRAPSA